MFCISLFGGCCSCNAAAAAAFCCSRRGNLLAVGLKEGGGIWVLSYPSMRPLLQWRCVGPGGADSSQQLTGHATSSQQLTGHAACTRAWAHTCRDDLSSGIRSQALRLAVQPSSIKRLRLRPLP